MASSHPYPFELEVTISSAKDLKNVNWRHGDLKPYAVVWVDPNFKCSTKVDHNGDTNPVWDEKLVLPLPAPIEDSTLFIDIVHANAPEGTKPLIGSAKLRLREILDDFGIGSLAEQSLKLKRPSGRPHGKLVVKILIRDVRYRSPPAAPYYASSYGVPPPPAYSRDYGSQHYDPYGQPPPPTYAAAPPPPTYATAPPPTYAAAPPAVGYSSGAPAYDQGVVGKGEKKSGKFGVGTGLAVGAVAGVLGGLALAEGAEYVENKIADRAAEKVEENSGYGGYDDYDDGGYGGDDF